MQSPEVREAIFEAITSTLVTGKARGSDMLAIHRHSVEPESVTSRTWMVSLTAPPTKSELDSCDLFEATYQCSGFYPAGTDTDDRIGSDIERLHSPLWSLHYRHQDIQESAPGVPSIERVPGMLIARIDLRILYRLDSTLL
jgi:hypothetical protein